LTIPASVTTIGEFAFFGCSSLTSVVTSMGKRASPRRLGMASLRSIWGIYLHPPSGCYRMDFQPARTCKPIPTAMG
jgi:hypothetical protein